MLYNQVKKNIRNSDTTVGGKPMVIERDEPSEHPAIITRLHPAEAVILARELVNNSSIPRMHSGGGDGRDYRIMAGTEVHRPHLPRLLRGIVLLLLLVFSIRLSDWWGVRDDDDVVEVEGMDVVMLMPV